MTETMKTIITSICLLLSSVLIASASAPLQDNTTVEPPADAKLKKEQRQEYGALKGPRAKNYPTWKYQSTPVAVKPTVAPISTKTFGPTAKNSHPWQNDKPTQRILIKKKEGRKLMGPRAKNHKPWNN